MLTVINNKSHTSVEVGIKPMSLYIIMHQLPGGLQDFNLAVSQQQQQQKQTESNIEIKKKNSSIPSSTMVYFFFSSPLKEREDENIQKRDCPFLGPSFRNSCPKPFPHFPQDTLRAMGDSSYLDTLSGFTVSVNAGQGEECSNFFEL